MSDIYDKIREAGEQISKNIADMVEDFKKQINEAYQKGYDAGIIASSFVDKSDEAYQRGLEDAWEAAKKLFSSMADSDIEKAFPIEWNNGGFKALMNLQPQEAIAKLKAYEENKDGPIKVGDIVDRYIDGKFDSRGIYLEEDDGYWRCLFDTGAILMTFAYPKEQFKKTGKHYDIAPILEAMRT